MDGRLALSRRRQDGRAADYRLPLTERVLGRLPGPRLAWVLAWAAVPAAAGLLPGSYLATVGAEPLPVRLLTGLVYAYAVALALWAVGRLTREATRSNARWTSWQRAPSRPPRQCSAAWPAPGGRWRSRWGSWR